MSELKCSNKKMLGVIHLIHCPLLIVYPYVSTGYDLLYLTYFLGMALSYLCFKNECLISYCAKKQVDPDYRAGSKMDWYPEMHMFTENDKRIKLYFTVTTCIYLYSLYLVVRRALKKRVLNGFFS